MKNFTKFLALAFIAAFALASCHKNGMTNDPTPGAPPIATTQWARLTTLPADNITALEVINNVIYAGSSTSKRVYMSADNGVTWTASAQIEPVTGANLPGLNVPDVRITALAMFNNKIYVGTDLDIYSSNDNGKTWTNAGSLIEIVTSFAIWNGNLYASSYREGILKLNTATNQWEPFASGLASIFVFDNTATKVLATDAGLFGATAYSFATYSTAQQIWVRKNYYNHAPYNLNTWWTDYTIDLVYNQGTLLGQVYMEYPTQQVILRSDDLGTTWTPDTVKLRNDLVKYTMHGLQAGSTKYYSISNQDTISVGTWIQQKEKTAPTGSTWANGEEFLPTIHSWAIRENNGVLFLATDGGLYFRKS